MARSAPNGLPMANRKVLARRLPWWQSSRSRTLLQHVLIYLILCALSAVFLVPFLWQLSSALKPNYELSLFPPHWIPQSPQWGNFAAALTQLPFNLFLKNTLIVEVGAIAGTLISCTMVAYAFARLRAPGRNLLFGLVLSTMMLPSAVTLIPTYVIFLDLHWTNSLLPLIVPAWFGNPFFIFLLRQFFRSIPAEMEESARLDGANVWQIIWWITVPLSKPALATVIIFTFVGVWQDFLGPLIYLNTVGNYTLALGITLYQTPSAVGNTSWNLMMAASTAITVPVLLLFFFAQRYFIEGITLTGLKG